LSETYLRDLQNSSMLPIKFKGVMIFFPLIDDRDSLAEFDYWVRSHIWLALRLRSRLLGTQVSKNQNLGGFLARHSLNFRQLPRVLFNQ